MALANNARRCRSILLLIVFCIVTTLGFLYNIRVKFLKMDLPAQPLVGDPPYQPAMFSTPSCTPRSNILFLKTHKCASSAIQNIFMRYGDRHHLIFALPIYNNYLGHPAPFDRKMLPSLEKYNFSYNIFTHHTRFNYKEMSAIMPPDTVYITVVRNPVDLFESMFSYYDFPRYLNRKINKSLDELIKSQSFPRLLPIRRILSKFGFNQMLFDLGMEPRAMKRDATVINYIQGLDKIFDLVMVAERMDESLILLKDLLCWTTEDVITFKSNSRDKKFKTALSEPAREKLLTYNHADNLLYNYFNRRLDERIDAFGRERMEREVEAIRSLTDHWYRECIKGETSVLKNRPPQKFYVNKKVMAFEVKSNNTFCENLTKPELVYTDLLMQRQAFFYPKKPTTSTRSKLLERIKKAREKKTRST